MIEISTDIKITVAGCGSAGRNSIREFMKFNDVEITACCDTEETLARFTAQEFGIPAYYTDAAEMLDSEAADVIVVAVPDGEHLSIAMEAFSRGINVFCESPMASNYAEAVEMTKAARESGLVAVMNNTAAGIPVIFSAISSIKNGSLGKVKYFEAACMQNRLDSRILDDPYEEKRLLWRLSSAAGSAGAIGELGFLLYDLAVKVCGEPKEVSSMIKNISGFDEVEEYQELDLTAGDTFVSQLEFKDGAAGVVRGSWTAGGPFEQITMKVYGENAMLSIDTADSETEFTVHSADGTEKIKADTGLKSGRYESFLTAVKGEGTAVSDFDQALKIQYYIEQSILSAEGGLRLHIDSPEE